MLEILEGSKERVIVLPALKWDYPHDLAFILSSFVTVGRYLGKFRGHTYMRLENHYMQIHV